MKVNKGYKIVIYPTKEQERKIHQFMNARIVSWNFGLEKQSELLERNDSLLTLSELKDLFKKELETNSKYQWIKEEGVPFHLFHFSLRDLNTAFNRYLKKKSKYPKFKSTRDTYKSFVQRNDMKQFQKDKVQINKIGKVSCNEEQLDRMKNVRGKYVIPTISYDGLNYHYSVSIETDYTPINKPKTDPIGIDLGVRDLIHLSNGESLVVSEKEISHLLRREKLLAKKLGRAYQRTRGEGKSKNLIKLEKDKLKVNKKIRDYRNDKIYKAVSHIISKNPEYVVMEDLNVSGMRMNKPLSRSLNDNYFRFIRDQVEYKCNIHGIPFYLADRYYPSTKLCSGCGTKNYPGNSKMYECESCGLEIDRDLNAAINLREYPNKK